jgi:hypothetical protein
MPKVTINLPNGITALEVRRIAGNLERHFKKEDSEPPQGIGGAFILLGMIAWALDDAEGKPEVVEPREGLYDH